MIVEVIVNSIDKLWWTSNAVVTVFSSVFLLIPKFSFSEEEILNCIILIKEKIKVRKTKVLKNFIEKINNRFNNAREIENDIYTSILDDFQLYDNYHNEAEKIRAEVKSIKTILVVFIIIALFTLGIGFIFPQSRSLILVINIIIIILTFILLPIGRSLQSKTDNLRNNPKII